MYPRHRLALAPALVLGAALWPAAAQAATVGSQAPCVRSVPGVKSFPVHAEGFPAGAPITFRADGADLGSGQADAGGTFDNAADPFPAPPLPAGRNLETVQLTADDGHGTTAGPVSVPLVRVTVALPARARPWRRVRFRVFGFLPGKEVFLHIRRHNRTRGRFSLGVAATPCGTVVRRLRFMPLRHYREGTYRYAFSHSRRYDPKQVIFSGKVTIYRTFEPTQAVVARATAWG